MTYAWGLDPASGGFALAIVRVQEMAYVASSSHEVKLVGDATEARAERRVTALYELAQEVFADAFIAMPPEAIGIEQPAGPTTNGKPELLAGWAALTIAATPIADAAVGWLVPATWQGRDGAAVRAFDFRADEFVQDVSDRRFAEKGRHLPASHPFRAKPMKKLALARARAAGYEGDSPDEADACCIALAAARRLTS